MGSKAFGEQNPTMGEDAVSWQTWSDGAGNVPTIDGDADWGKLKLDLSGEEGRSAVYDLGSEVTRTFTLTRNRYGTGSGDAVLQIRTSTTAFLQDDILPEWTNYVSPVSANCRYVQVRETTNFILLPQNLLITPDISLEDFEDDAEWSVGSGSIADNVSEYKVGTQSIKLTTPSGGTGQMTRIVNLSGIDYEFFGFWFYLHNSTSNYTSIKFYISSTTDFSKSFNFTIDPPNNILAWPLSGRWMLYRIPLSEMTNTGGESWANTMIRIRFEVVSASGVVNASFDELVGGYPRVPVVLFRHDGSYDTGMDTGAFAHQNSIGVPSDMYTHMAWMKNHEAGIMTVAEMQTLYAGGWGICVYGQTLYDGAMGDLSLEEQEYGAGYGMQYVRNALACPGSERHFAFTGNPTIHENSNSKTALINAGFLTAIGGYGALNRYAYYPPGDWYNIEFTVAGNSLATNKARVDAAITHGYFLIINCDDLDASGLSSADYIELIDYIYEKWQAGLIYPLTMNQFYSLSLGPIAYPNPCNQEESPWKPDVVIADIDLEDGTLNALDDTVGGGYLSTSASAALNGTNNGLAVVFDGTTNNRYAVKFYGMYNNETDLRCRIYLDPNGMTLAGFLTILSITSNYLGYAASGMRVWLTYSGGYFITVRAYDDATNAYTGTARSLTDAPHYIELHMHKATTSVSADGYVRLYIDGVLRDTLGSLDNYDQFVLCDRIFWGGIAVSASNNGTLYMDELICRRDDTEIGA